jgi:hypothetical protein
MFIKKIGSIESINLYANVMIFNVEYFFYPSDSEKKGLINFTSAKISIEFYDEDSVPMYYCEFVIDELPVNNNICVKDFEIDIFPVRNNIHLIGVSNPDAKIIFDTQLKKILDEIKSKYGVTYYDDKYEIDKKMTFSHIMLYGYGYHNYY